MIKFFELALVLVLAAPVAKAAAVIPTLHHTVTYSPLINADIQAASQGGFDGMLAKENRDA